MDLINRFFKSFFYCKKCASIANDKTCPHGDDDKINFKGTAIRDMFQKGKMPPNDMTREEVAKAVLAHKNPFVGQ